MNLRKSHVLDSPLVKGHPPHENCGTSQAFCTPMMKSCDCRRLSAFSEHSAPGNCGTSQALCTPRMNLPTASGSEDFLGTPLTKIPESLGLSAPPIMKIVDSFRL